MVIYREATIDDIDIVTKLGLLLYSDDNTFESLYKENLSLVAASDKFTVLAFCGETAIGMAQCSIRHDYVEGTDSGAAHSRVGYLEGVFVCLEHRRNGVAKALVNECEVRAKQQGCKEFASDCKLTNIDSYNFHIKIGFDEVSRNIHFAKEL